MLLSIFIVNVDFNQEITYLLDIHLHLPGISKCCNNPRHANCDSKGAQMSVCAKGGYRIQTHDALNLEIQSMLSIAGICSTRDERGIFQTNWLDCNKRGDLTFLNVSQSTAKQDGKKQTNPPFVPDNSDRRISGLLLDTTVVHPLLRPNAKHKLTLNEAKQNLHAADKACARNKNKYDVICAQYGLNFLPIIFESTGKMHPLL